MIKQEKMKIVTQNEIADSIFEMVLEGTLVQEMREPGQFVHVRVQATSEPLLRRPISICQIDKENNRFTMIYRTDGIGTTMLSRLSAGETVDILGPLGSGFPVNMNLKKALLVGGGIGVPPLYELSKQLRKQGIQTIHVLGHETENKVFYQEAFSGLGETFISTVDGTIGTKGFVTDVLDKEQIDFDVLYACGPTVMLRALEEKFPHVNGYFSLEERMGCGIGACFACVCQLQSDTTGTAYRKICTDGPVFPVGEVIL